MSSGDPRTRSHSQLEVLLQHFPQIIHFRAGQLLSLLRSRSHNHNRSHGKTKQKQTLPVPELEPEQTTEAPPPQLAGSSSIQPPIGDIKLQDLYVTNGHICISLVVPDVELQCIVLLDLVAPHVLVPTPKDMRTFLKSIKRGVQCSLPHTCVLFLSSPLVSFQFIATPESESGSEFSAVSFVLVTQCGLLATAAFVTEESRWEILTNTFNICDAHQSHHAQRRWVESAQFHPSTRTLLWVEAGSESDRPPSSSESILSPSSSIYLPPHITPPASPLPKKPKVKAISRFVMSAKVPSKIIFKIPHDTSGTHDIDINYPSKSGSGATIFVGDVLYQNNSVTICPVLQLPILKVSSHMRSVNDKKVEQVQLAPSQAGCWVLVPLTSPSFISNVDIDCSSNDSSQQFSNQKSNTTATTHVEHALYYFDFSTGRKYDCPELLNPNSVDLFTILRSVSLILLDCSDTLARSCSSVLVVYEYCRTTPGYESSLMVGRVSYLGGSILVQPAWSLPDLPIPTNEAPLISDVQALQVEEGLLLVLFEHFLIYTSLSALMSCCEGFSQSVACSHNFWNMASSPDYEFDSMVSSGIWIRKNDILKPLGATPHAGIYTKERSLHAGLISGDSTLFYNGTIPTEIGIYTSCGVMFNIELKKSRKLHSVYQKRIRKKIVNELAKSEGSIELWTEFLLSDQFFFFIPPNLLLRQSNDCKEGNSYADIPSFNLCCDEGSHQFISSLVEIIALMDAPLSCFCCQRCKCGKLHAENKYDCCVTLSSPGQLSRILSDNREQLVQLDAQDNSFPSLVSTCSDKLVEYFSSCPVFIADGDSFSLRSFDLNDFVKSIESSLITDLPLSNDGYLEGVIKFWLQSMNSNFADADPDVQRYLHNSFFDLILVVLNVALSVKSVTPLCQEVGTQPRLCMRSLPSTGYTILRRCLVTTLETLLGEEGPPSCPYSHYNRKCSRLSDKLKQALKTSATLPKEQSIMQPVSAIHKDTILQLLALCGNLEELLNMFTGFGRYRDTLDFVRLLLDRYHSFFHITGGSAVVDISLKSSHRLHDCGQSDDEQENDDESIDNGFEDTWITAGNDESDDEEECSTSVPPSTTPSDNNQYNSVQPGELSAAAVTCIALNYRKLVQSALFAALVLEEWEVARTLCGNVLWDQIDLENIPAANDKEEESEVHARKRALLVAEVIQNVRKSTINPKANSEEFMHMARVQLL